MAFCTQNRCADKTALHLVSPSEAYRSTRSIKTRAELAHPFWTLRPLRSGFEPLTQGFSVLCSNQLSYLNNFPKVFFLHRRAPYTFFLSKKKEKKSPYSFSVGPFSLVRKAFEQLFQLPPNLPTCSRTERRPGTYRPEGACL